MTQQIFAAEINFQDTPLHIRDKFNETEKNIKRLLITFRRRVEEVYILANRQRFTVYIAHENMDPLTDFFHEEHHLKGYVQFYYNTGESVTHLMATASGLLSSVKGEGQILTDIIQCYEWATASSCMGMTLDNTLSKAIETGKSVRTKTGIDKFCASVVETGFELLYNRLENLHDKNFLIVGTGKLAGLALECLTREGISNIVLAGHDPVRLAELADKFSIKVIEVQAIAGYFADADVVIGASHHELERQSLPGKREGIDRQNKTRIILDLGIPPNFDAEFVEIWAEEFYNLDDLKRLHSSPLEAFGGLEAAWRIVMKASSDFTLLLQLLHQSPVLSAYLMRQFTLKNGEWKFRPKRTLRSMLLFKKTENMTGTASVKDYVNAKIHLNNHVADNGREIVKNVGLKKFKFFLSEN